MKPHERMFAVPAPFNHDDDVLGVGALAGSAEAAVISTTGLAWPISLLLDTGQALSVTDLISRWKQLRPTCVRALADRRHTAPPTAVLGPPVGPTSKVICAIDNYSDHAAEFATEIFPRPIFFLKPFTALVGPNGTVRLPRSAKRVDYEVELAVVIGTQCSAVSPAMALEYIAGYCLFLDISARDFRSIPYTWFAMKCWDSFGPIGPYITEAHRIADPLSLGISLTVNGEVRMQGNTSQMVFSPMDLISAASEVTTLQPGDIVATGTIAGVGPAQVGDIVNATIEGIGSMAVSVAASNIETLWHDSSFPNLYSEYRAHVESETGPDPLAP